MDSHEHVFSLVGHAGDHDAQADGFLNTLLHHLGKTAEILVFLIGAMTIVEIIDLHRGFEVLKGAVNTKSKRRHIYLELLYDNMIFYDLICRKP